MIASKIKMGMKINLYPFVLCIILRCIPFVHMIAVDISSSICRRGILMYSYVPKTLLFVIISSKFLENINPNAKYVKNIGFF